MAEIETKTKVYVTLILDDDDIKEFKEFVSIIIDFSESPSGQEKDRTLHLGSDGYEAVTSVPQILELMSRNLPDV